MFLKRKSGEWLGRVAIGAKPCPGVVVMFEAGFVKPLSISRRVEKAAEKVELPIATWCKLKQTPSSQPQLCAS